MSKHPTSELSPRDLACIEYGLRLKELKDGYALRHWTYDYEFIKEELLKDARAARERIFRCCFECCHCDIEGLYCRKPGEEPCELTWLCEEACTCEHYEEGGGA